MDQKGAYVCKYSTALLLFPIQFNIFAGWIQVHACSSHRSIFLDSSPDAAFTGKNSSGKDAPGGDNRLVWVRMA